VKKEEVSVQAIEKEQQVSVQEQEILRKQKELEATVVKPADARRYSVQTEADAERYKLTAEAAGRAEAKKAQGLAEAEVIAATGRAEAEAIRQRGAAEAEVIRAKGLAEAEAMKKKAESYHDYGAAAVTEMMVKMLPELAKAVAEPLSKTEKIVMVSSGEGGALGASKITREIAQMMAQLPPVVESLSGISLKDIVGKIPGMTPPAGEQVEGTAHPAEPAAKAPEKKA